MGFVTFSMSLIFHLPFSNLYANVTQLQDSGFEFVKAIKESFIVEGAVNFYRHFNFTAMQGSTIHLFFAEVIPDGESCDVSCCRLLQDNDNGMIWFQ